MATEKKDEAVNIPTQSIPYPTGNAPEVDMMKEAHPMIVLEKERAEAAEKEAKAKKPEPEEAPAKGKK